jgi:hypothetical protein
MWRRCRARPWISGFGRGDGRSRAGDGGEEEVVEWSGREWQHDGGRWSGQRGVSTVYCEGNGGDVQKIVLRARLRFVSRDLCGLEESNMYDQVCCTRKVLRICARLEPTRSLHLAKSIPSKC